MIDTAVLNFNPSSLVLLNVVLAIVMFAIAIDLTSDNFKALLRAPKALLIGLASQFLVLPILTFLLVLVMQPQASIALGLILVAACPGGNLSNFITHRAGGNTALSVSMTGMASVLAVFLTPINVALWGGLYEPSRAILQEIAIDPVQVATTVVFILVLPLTVGVMLNTHFPRITGKIRTPMQWLSLAIFIAFVSIAFINNWQNFVHYIGFIAILVVLHNGLGLFGGFATASLTGLSAYDRRAITIETGMQNSGLGLVLIFTFFDGLGGMALVAGFWGVWHAISGILLARYWPRVEKLV